MALKVHVPTLGALEAPPSAITITVMGASCSWIVRPFELTIYERAYYAGQRARQEAIEADAEAPDDLLFAKRRAAYLRALARHAVVDFGEDFLDAGGRPIVFSDVILDAVMTIPEVANAFETAYCGPLAERGAEKNGSGAVPPGISNQAAGANGANTVET